MDGKYSGKTKFWAFKEEKKTQTHKDLDFFLVGRMAWQKSRFFKQTEMGPWHYNAAFFSVLHTHWVFSDYHNLIQLSFIQRKKITSTNFLLQKHLDSKPEKKL